MQGANFGAFTYQEDKRCMLAFLKSGADFSKRRAARSVATNF
jgi:hypothetical protein